MDILGPRHVRRTRLIVLVALAVLSACAPQQPVREPSVGAPDPAQKAWDLRHAGDLEAAAKEFLRAAKKSKPPQSLIYQLYAAETYLQAQQRDSAAEILAEFPVDKSDADLRAWATILEGNLALMEGQPEQTLVKLDAAASLDEKRIRARDIHELRAQALLQLNRPLEAAKERILLELLLSDQAEIDANRQTIWSILMKLPAGDLEAQLAAAPEGLRGWMELVVIAQTEAAGTPQSAGRFAQWRKKHPHHPAEEIFVSQVPEVLTVPAIPPAPRQIALLLPLDGQTASAGAAVRDGFFAAWYADARDNKPAISVYNTTPANAAQIYDQAVAEGAELIVGPLEKAAVEALVRRGPLTSPTLALNQIGAPSTEGAALIQFGLSPEDEARKVAERAKRDSRMRALVITSDDNWGERVFRAFKEQWEAQGGVVLDHATYSNRIHDFATPVKKVLDIEGSQERAAELRKVLHRELVTQPRPRQDADVLFLGAFSLQARQIQPQLLFFQAGELPIYATSHVYMGNTDVTRDADLNGIVFGDMPCIVLPERSAVTTLLNPDRTDKSGTYTRLYALGIDAYRLIPQLGTLRSDPTASLAGETGTLTLNASGHVVRELTWMRFANGVPVPLDSPPPAP